MADTTLGADCALSKRDDETNQQPADRLFSTLRVAPVSRRSLFAGTAALGVAAAIGVTGSAVASSIAGSSDAGIKSLLVQWADAVRAYVRQPTNTAEEEAKWEALLDAASDILDQAKGIPVTTLEGFAIKSYMALHHEYGGTVSDSLAIDYNGGSMTTGDIAESLVADAFKASPLLAATVGASA